MFLHKELATDSGGAGKFRGGLGHALAVKSTSDDVMTFAMRMDRTEHPTVGVAGGLSGGKSQIGINGEPVHPKKTRELNKDDVFAIQCAGGAGHGKPEDRANDAIEADLLDGYISQEAAIRDYGWKK